MPLLFLAEMLLLAALWGGSFLFMRIASPSLGPVWLIEIRLLLAGLALLPFLLKLNLLSTIRDKLIPIFVVGCFNFAFPFLCYAFASIFLPAGFTSILNATAPLFGAIVALIWWSEKLTTGKILGCCLGLIGTIVLVGWKPIVVNQSFFLSIIAGLGAALMYAAIAPYIKQKLAHVSPLAIATCSQLSGALVLLPIMPFTIPTTMPTNLVILAVLGLALLSTSLAYMLYFRLIKNIGSSRALTVAYLIPVFAMLWGSLFLQEPITESMVMGGSLILLGTAIANNLFASIKIK